MPMTMTTPPHSPLTPAPLRALAGVTTPTPYPDPLPCTPFLRSVERILAGWQLLLSPLQPSQLCELNRSELLRELFRSAARQHEHCRELQQLYGWLLQRQQAEVSHGQH